MKPDLRIDFQIMFSPYGLNDQATNDFNFLIGVDSIDTLQVTDCTMIL